MRRMEITIPSTLKYDIYDDSFFFQLVTLTDSPPKKNFMSVPAYSGPRIFPLLFLQSEPADRGVTSTDDFQAS